MKTYELTYLISPEITLEEAESKAKEITSAVLSKEGTILKQSIPTAITLSYPIKKYASGFLGTIEFQLNPQKIIELEIFFTSDEKIIRHIIIATKPIKKQKEKRVLEALQTKQLQKDQSLFKIKEDFEVAEKPATSKEAGRKKVEFKDIEQKLEELLNE